MSPLEPGMPAQENEGSLPPADERHAWAESPAVESVGDSDECGADACEDGGNLIPVEGEGVIEELEGTSDASAFSGDHTQSYLDLIRSLHDEWDALEAASDLSVTASPRVMESVMSAVRAEVRRGEQVQVPPTDLGPFTVSEASLRTLVRRAIDSVPGAEALRSTVDHAPVTDGHRGLGVPETIHCRVSAHVSVKDLPAFAEQIRQNVLDACQMNLGISPSVNVHVEDLHDEQ